MFNWLKRRAAAGAPPATRSPPSRTSAADGAQRAGAPAHSPPRFVPTAPLPEVVAEGNTQADWSAWEDSMNAIDSQMQELSPTSRIYVRETRPSQLDEIDPFAGVRRKS